MINRDIPGCSLNQPTMGPYEGKNPQRTNPGGKSKGWCAMTISTYVYLSDDIRKHSTFHENNKGCPWVGDNHTYLHEDDGVLCLTSSNEDVEIPALFLPYVLKVTVRDIMHCPKRELGIYTHESATATLADSTFPQRISVVAKNVKDAMKLLHLVRTGAIRPVESFEVPQTGRSMQEIHDELERLKAENLKLACRIANARYARRVCETQLKEIISWLADHRFFISVNLVKITIGNALEAMRTAKKVGVIKK